MEFSCSKGLLLTFVGEFFVQPKTIHLQIGLQSSMNKTKKIVRHKKTVWGVTDFVAYVANGSRLDKDLFSPQF